jgi:hypothetical protein
MLSTLREFPLKKTKLGQQSRKFSYVGLVREIHKKRLHRPACARMRELAFKMTGVIFNHV